MRGVQPVRYLCVLALLAAMTLSCCSGHAEAHVKWFCGPVDVTLPPLALRQVLSPMFFLLAIASLVLISGGVLFDTLAARSWPARFLFKRHPEGLEEWLIRGGVAIYMIALSDKVAPVPWNVAGDTTILTPELLAPDRWVGWLQIGVAATLLSRRTCPLAALGIVVLYAVGIGRNGIFHMTDYTFFPGLAGYIALSSPLFDRRPDMRRWRVPLITATLGFGLMWTAIEKFLYPEWADIVLTDHPRVTFGFPVSLVTVAAGFVEFSVAFYLLIGRSLLPLDAAIVTLVLLAAIPEFGALDTAGHLPLVAVLLVIIMHGPTPLQEMLRPRHDGAIAATVRSACLFALSLGVMMAMYYALQMAGTWPGR